MEIGVRELRDGLSRWLEVVRRGGELVVTDRGRPVARLIGVESPAPFERLLAEGIIRSPRARKGLAPRRVRGGGPVADLVREQRR